MTYEFLKTGVEERVAWIEQLGGVQLGGVGPFLCYLVACAEDRLTDRKRERPPADNRTIMG